MNGDTILLLNFILSILEVLHLIIIDIVYLLFTILVDVYLIWIIYLVLLYHLIGILVFGYNEFLVLMQGVHWYFNHLWRLNVFHHILCLRNHHIMLINLRYLHLGHSVWLLHAINLLAHGHLIVNLCRLFLSDLLHHGLVRRESVDHLILWILDVLLVELFWVFNILLNNITVHIDNFIVLSLNHFMFLEKDFLFIHVLYWSIILFFISGIFHIILHSSLLLNSLLIFFIVGLNNLNVLFSF